MNWKKILLGLIGIRFLAWCIIFYSWLEWTVYYNTEFSIDPERYHLATIQIFFSLLDVLTIITFFKLRNDNRIYILLSASFALIASVIGVLVVAYWFYSSNSSYEFHRDHVALFLLMMSGIFSIFITRKKKIGLHERTECLAKPVDNIINN